MTQKFPVLLYTLSNQFIYEDSDMTTNTKPLENAIISDASFDARELTQNELDRMAGGASSYFLKLDGIEGESTDASHDKWIDVLS